MSDRYAPRGTDMIGSAQYRLLYRARAVLAEARAVQSPDERFCLAQLGALRAAAALLATRARPARSRKRLVSVWELLPALAPQYHDWALLFAASARVRAAVEAGTVGAVSERRAADHLRAAEQFLHLVEAELGLLAAALAG